MKKSKENWKAKRNIILIGFMGCGKSTVGIQLSYHLRRILVDTDKLIEKKYKMKIKDIFATKGEEAFRRMETECLRDLLKGPGGKIISVGGGMPLRKENRRLLRRLGIVYYLKATPETIYGRLKHDKTRPLLQGKDPEHKIKELLTAREEIYQSTCRFQIAVDDRTFEEIVTEIVERHGQ